MDYLHQELRARPKLIPVSRQSPRGWLMGCLEREKGREIERESIYLPKTQI